MDERRGLHNRDSVSDKNQEEQYIERLRALRTEMLATKDPNKQKIIAEQIRTIENARRDLVDGQSQEAA